MFYGWHWIAHICERAFAHPLGYFSSEFRTSSEKIPQADSRPLSREDHQGLRKEKNGSFVSLPLLIVDHMLLYVVGDLALVWLILCRFRDSLSFSPCFPLCASACSSWFPVGSTPNVKDRRYRVPSDIIMVSEPRWSRFGAPTPLFLAWFCVFLPKFENPHQK